MAYVDVQYIPDLIEVLDMIAKPGAGHNSVEKKAWDLLHVLRDNYSHVKR